MMTNIPKKKKTVSFVVPKNERETVTSEVFKKNIPGPALWKIHDHKRLSCLIRNYDIFIISYW